MGKIMWYLPRKFVSPLAFKILVGIELPFTIAVLALFGIAAPNLYRKRLWQDGADNGFNSSPDELVYRFANYEPYTVPRPWTQFSTNFNLVISVLSTFFLLAKTPMFVLHVFYPPLSVLVHTVLIVLYCVSAAWQAGSDTSDPGHPQSGPPCVIFLAHLVLAIISCFPTDETRERQQKKLEKIRHLEELKSLKSPCYPNFMQGENGLLQPITPRTMAFNQLGGSNDLPLRTNPAQPGTPGQPMMYFPPPPKKATTKEKSVFA
ncbi:predicted protein [Uncinocarpus reesii 1704]|uniref:Uncharacterized protein n=1 Tax=Uncinocarpus reesii (strain UAMH 1704) TaxID=336963 RepID=C4JDW5_UNCRE|nr:uncharacterized protein UREG_00605 [Uncinocarpus reesii 1704]EEP75758.1 predicted protein [Uncinocarpus reesii 1704]